MEVLIILFLGLGVPELTIKSGYMSLFGTISWAWNNHARRSFDEQGGVEEFATKRGENSSLGGV